MKKVVAGGFLSLLASIWTLTILAAAGNNLSTSWNSRLGRLLSTIIDMKLLFPLILCVLFIAFGIALMLYECFKKEK